MFYNLVEKFLLYLFSVICASILVEVRAQLTGALSLLLPGGVLGIELRS